MKRLTSLLISSGLVGFGILLSPTNEFSVSNSYAQESVSESPRDTKKSNIRNLRLTIEDIVGLSKNPEDHKLIDKVQYIYENPEIVLNSFSKQERWIFDEFFKRSLDNIDPMEILNYYNKDVNWEDVIGCDYEKYPFKVNFKNPSLRDKMIIFFNESVYCDREIKDKPVNEDVDRIIYTISKYAFPSNDNNAFKFPFKIVQSYLHLDTKHAIIWQTEKVPEFLEGMSKEEYFRELRNFVKLEYLVKSEVVDLGASYKFVRDIEMKHKKSIRLKMY